MANLESHPVQIDVRDLRRERRQGVHPSVALQSVVYPGQRVRLRTRCLQLELRNPSASDRSLQNGARGIIPLGARDADTGLVFRYPRPKIDDLRHVHSDFEPEYELAQDLWQLELRHEVDWANVIITGGVSGMVSAAGV